MLLSLTPLLHDLALLYLALTLGADGELAHEERAAMRDQLRAWTPGADPALCDHAIREAVLSYGNGVDAERLDALVRGLGSRLDAEGRARVLADLRTLAASDAVVTATEVGFIERIERAWSS